MSGKPNIILIVMDTARAKNFSCYGYEKETTPFIDELASRGTKFERCISQSPWTLPSHAAMFSGEYPHKIGINSNKDTFEYEDALPIELNNEGYRTIGVSNNGYISSDFGMDSGFDDFTFIDEPTIFNTGELWEEMKGGEKKNRWDTKFEKYLYFVKESLKKLKFRSLINGFFYILNKKFWLSDDGANKTNKIIKKKLPKVKEPFFLFVNYVEPHSEYRPPRKFAKKFTNENFSKLDRLIGYDPLELIAEDKTLSKEEAKYLESLYDAELNYLDSKIREIYDYLHKTNKINNTILIITSDHGEHFGEHSLYRHLGLYQEVLHVPLIILDTRKEKRKNIEEVVELKNIYTYIIKLVEGRKGEFESSEVAVSTYSGLNSHFFYLEENWPKLLNSELNDPMFSKTSRGFKKIEKFDNGTENWEINSSFEEEKTKKETKLSSTQVNLTELKVKEEEKEVSEEVKKRLKSLGYLRNE